MARWEFKLPDIGEGVTEGEIVAWLVRPGDAVTEDQPLVEMMTDKATVTIAAPRPGLVLETRGRVGENVPVNDVLVVFELEPPPLARSAPPTRGPAANGAASNSRHDNGPAEAAEDSPRAGLDVEASSPAPTAGTSPAAVGDRSPYFNEKPLATPATRQLARDLELDLRRVPPTGPQGRVTRRDLESFAGAPPGTGPFVLAASHGAARDPVRVPPPASAATPATPRGPLEERVPMAGLRRKIAQKMALSKATAAHFTFVEECDASALVALRARLQGPALAHGVKLSFLPFIIKAVVASLRLHPYLNAALDESTNEIVLRKFFNIGVATATDAGLLVPVVHGADKKSLLEIGRDIERLANEARAGKARLEDLQGSTFTITSLGARAGLLATPIINFPEVAILGVHQIKQRPVVRDGQIVIGEVMLLSLSFDHRVVDGHVGAAFAYEVIGYLEHPDRLLLEMA
jgi:pyruvate dehydrogenase E2 component (dihydrolipoamide acetyltransferase)